MGKTKKYPDSSGNKTSERYGTTPGGRSYNAIRSNGRKVTSVSDPNGTSYERGTGSRDSSGKTLFTRTFKSGKEGSIKGKGPTKPVSKPTKPLKKK